MTVLTLSTGRTIDAYDNVIGIDEDLGVFGGYDDVVDRLGYPPRDRLTRQEREELADIMIARWQAFKAAEPFPPYDSDE